MEKKFKLKMVSMPNYLYLDMPPRPQQEGINSVVVCVNELSNEEIKEYAEEIKQEFIAHCNRQKEQQKNDKNQIQIR